MTREGSTFARWAMRRMVAASRPRSPNSARAASRMRCAVAARFAALLLGSLTPFTLPLLSEWCTVGSTSDERDRGRSYPPPGARSSHGSTSRQVRSGHRRVTRAGLRASRRVPGPRLAGDRDRAGAGRAGLHDLARSSGGRLAVETVADVSTDTFVRLMVTNALSPMRVVETLQDLVAPNGTIAVMSSGQGSIANNDKGGFEVYRRANPRTESLEDITVKIIAIEEHWNSVSIRDALDRLQGEAR